jgi:hypothetical protein
MPRCKTDTFCGVNAHFQNGIAESAIPNLLESVCKQLLHTHACWPVAVHFALWPYTLRNAAHLHNSLPVLEDGTSRLELFSSICVGSNMTHAHTSGCPVFALQNTLASGNQIPCWTPHARLGLILGPSPMHVGMSTLFLTWSPGVSHHNNNVVLTISSRQHIMANLKFVAPSAGNNKRTWIVQPQFFPRCQCQNSTA